MSGGLSAVPVGVIIYHWLALLTNTLSGLILGLLAISPLSPKVAHLRNLSMSGDATQIARTDPNTLPVSSKIR